MSDQFLNTSFSVESSMFDNLRIGDLIQEDRYALRCLSILKAIVDYDN